MSASSLGRRQLGALAAATLLVGSVPGSAADDRVYVSGFALPINLDPHQVYDPITW
jgi:hypothetical protein